MKRTQLKWLQKIFIEDFIKYITPKPKNFKFFRKERRENAFV